MLFRRCFSTVQSGTKYTPEFKKYLRISDSKLGSFFHDVPINFNKDTRTLNMVVEIPRWSNGKFEISKTLPLNPIVQDSKKGKLRFIKNVYPFHGYPCTYGSIPQTWEDNTKAQDFGSSGQLKGDGDPVDVVDISSITADIGDVREVKVLGSLAMIDDGEIDWKVIGINSKDPLSSQITDLEDVETHMPNLLSDLRNWFRDYKIPDGKGQNEFAYDGRYLEYNETAKVINECFESWDTLIQGKISAGDKSKIPEIKNSTLIESPEYSENLEVNLDAVEPEPKLSEEVDRIYFTASKL